MKPRAIAHLSQLTALLLVAGAAAGCSKKLRHMIVPNLLPEVKITAAPIDTNVVCTPDPVRSCYLLTLNWVGFDADGRVDHYLFAVDPSSEAGVDTVWQITRGNKERLLFSSRRELPRQGNDPAFARDFHVFVIKAVDNLGAAGPSVALAFFSYTRAPDVFITSPSPSSVFEAQLAPSVRISWGGSDADGVFHDKPVQYKYILLSPSSEFGQGATGGAVGLATLDPDSLRRYYAPGFVGWDSVGGDTTTAQYTNLTPEGHYLFAVVGFDEAGAYSPIFKLSTNMLWFQVNLAGKLGPKITAFSEFFENTWNGGYCPCAAAEFTVEVPADKKFTVNWTAVPDAGANLRSFRWAVDIQDVDDPTPRTDERTDLSHWSTPAINLTSVTLGPYAGDVNHPEDHRLYIEADENIDLKSLAIVHFQVIRAALTPGTTLIVDDTRLKPDVQRGQCTRPPVSGESWPKAAELDTFLFARGGFPWQCYPAGSVSKPGLFAGYSFDTLNTRIQKDVLTVPLTKISRYEHVIWIVEQKGADFGAAGTDLLKPRTALRYMTSRARFNSLGVYVKQGGKVWLMGGGGAFASTIEWNDPTNDPGTKLFSSTSPRRELATGRFMYDVAHWQSQIVERTSNFNGGGLTRFAGRHERPPVGRGPDPDPTSYTNYLRELPPRMEFKTPESDSLPPDRRSGFYPLSADIEYLDVENRILEDTSLDPDQPNPVSTLDTLYEATGGPVERDSTRHYAVMTYYHGPSAPQGFVFTGFDVWTYQRTQCQALVDFVMRRMWGLSRRTGSGYVASGEVAPLKSSAASARVRERPGLGRPVGLRPWRPAVPPRRPSHRD